METWTDSAKKYEGKIVDVRFGTVRLSDGQEATREVVEHPGGVGVVPYTGDGVILVKQYRIAVEQHILEIPAGKLEGVEDPEARGRAELEEEAGYVAGQMIPAGAIYPSVGFLTEKIHLFLALDLAETARRPEWDEDIEVVTLSLDEIRARLRANAFEDAKTIVGLYALLNYLEMAAP